MNNPCRKSSWLSAYLDGELSRDRAEALETHLQSCPRCRASLEALRQADSLVGDLPPLEPSADFDRTFWERVDAIEQRDRSRSWTRTLFGGWRPVWAGAMAGLAAVVLIYFSGSDALSPEELFIADHLELLDDFDLIGQLEMLEHLEATDLMKELS